MATEKSFQLYINEDNVKQYFSTSGGALNGASIGGKYITMRTSSTTATFTMNDAGRDVLFPSAVAIANKIDVWAQTISTLSNSKNTINVAIAGQNAITTERIHTSLTEHTGSISGNFIKSNTSAIYTIKIANGFIGAGVRDTSITAYFNQYACTANRVGNGVKRVSVSNAAPYEGETVTFSAEIYNGANFEGWFSDANCTQLVSSSTSHTISATDLTLYAKATIEAEIYNCAAVAGENVASAVVSDDSVVSGDNVTFTAQLENEGCVFDGWYSNSSYTNLVSLENPYTVAITADTTLYAKAHKKQFTMSVGAAEHGVASVNTSVAYYGDAVGFKFTPEDDTWELYGWYSDAEFTNLVSEDNPYLIFAHENVMLYPKVGIRRYKITLNTSGEILSSSSATTISMISVNTSRLTKEDLRNLRAGKFSSIPNEIIFSTNSKDGGSTSFYSVSIMAPLGSTVALYAASTDSLLDVYTVCFTENDSQISNGPHFVFTATKDAKYYASKRKARCECSAIALGGIEYAEAYPKTVQQEYTTLFSADVLSGYAFQGWYSDEACTTLVSSNNPYEATTPKYTTNFASVTYLTLYAKAIPIASQSTGIFLKQNGVYVEVAAAYKKVDGVWTQQTEPKNLFSGSAGGSESNYIYYGKIEP